MEWFRFVAHLSFEEFWIVPLNLQKGLGEWYFSSLDKLTRNSGDGLTTTLDYAECDSFYRKPRGGVPYYSSTSVEHVPFMMDLACDIWSSSYTQAIGGDQNFIGASYDDDTCCFDWHRKRKRYYEYNPPGITGDVAPDPDISIDLHGQRSP